MKIEAGYALTWHEIETAPESSGVYAWYSRLVISKADVENVIKRVNEARNKSAYDARVEVEEALDRFIYSPYREMPYTVALRGQLKPRYSGEVLHEPAKSDSLIERLANEPERFRVIADILKTAAPWFTAPLYIGMADNLRVRLKQHKTKIVELRDHQSSSSRVDQMEAGFANQIVARRFDPTNLFVHISEVNVGAGDREQNDIENILNRINYPIFGRN